MRRKVKAGEKEWRNTDSRENIREYHIYHVINKTKYETGACGMKSVL